VATWLVRPCVRCNGRTVVLAAVVVAAVAVSILSVLTVEVAVFVIVLVAVKEAAVVAVLVAVNLAVVAVIAANIVSVIAKIITALITVFLLLFVAVADVVGGVRWHRHPPRLNHPSAPPHQPVITILLPTAAEIVANYRGPDITHGHPIITRCRSHRVTQHHRVDNRLRSPFFANLHGQDHCCYRQPLPFCQTRACRPIASCRPSHTLLPHQWIVGGSPTIGKPTAAILLPATDPAAWHGLSVSYLVMCLVAQRGSMWITWLMYLVVQLMVWLAVGLATGLMAAK
jgi:hypothetical protein